MNFPVEARLKDGSPVEVVLASEGDIEPLRALYQTIVSEGQSYPHERMPDREEFLEYWIRGKSTVVAYSRDRSRSDMLGAYYLKPNWPGRSRHVANAGFIVTPVWRRKGLGWLLGALMLRHAKDLGYRSVLFNLVFSQNQPARHLWAKLGFSELAMIPGAVRNRDGTYQDALVMWRSLL